MSGIQYFIDSSESLGPCDAAAIYALIAKKIIDMNTLVWSEGQSDWLPIKARHLGNRSIMSNTTFLIG